MSSFFGANAGSFSPFFKTVSAGDSDFASVVLLTDFDGTDAATSATDASNSAHTLSFLGSAKLDTGIKKFGTASLELLADTDYVEVPTSADFQFDGEFTVEAWVYRTDTAIANRVIIGHNTSGVNFGWRLQHNSEGVNSKLQFLYSTDGSTAVHNLTADTATIPRDTWAHVAVDRDASNVMRIYVDGVMKASKAAATGTSFNSSTVLRIGRLSSTSTNFLGRIDEARITKGVARYASDAGYTVPTEAFPSS